MTGWFNSTAEAASVLGTNGLGCRRTTRAIKLFRPIFFCSLSVLAVNDAHCLVGVKLHLFSQGLQVDVSPLSKRLWKLIKRFCKIKVRELGQGENTEVIDQRGKLFAPVLPGVTGTGNNFRCNPVGNVIARSVQTTTNGHDDVPAQRIVHRDQPYITPLRARFLQHGRPVLDCRSF